MTISNEDYVKERKSKVPQSAVWLLNDPIAEDLFKFLWVMQRRAEAVQKYRDAVNELCRYVKNKFEGDISFDVRMGQIEQTFQELRASFDNVV